MITISLVLLFFFKCIFKKRINSVLLLLFFQTVSTAFVVCVLGLCHVEAALETPDSSFCQ